MNKYDELKAKLEAFDWRGKIRTETAHQASTAITELEQEIERLRQSIEAINNPDGLLCCSGHMCGCMGATIGQFVAWIMEDGIARDKSQLIAATRRATIEECAGIAEGHRYEDHFLNSCGLRKEHRADITRAIRALLEKEQ